MNPHRLLAGFFASALGSWATGACAQDAADGEDADLRSLLQVIAEETDLATRNRQNADYVPGIVSVLGADEAIALGARTVLDGIGLIPGIEVMRGQNGSATLRVRGIDAFFNSGNVKVLVDGTDTSFQVSAQNSAILLMPLQMVDRIEVIRGPGSSVYGDFAFLGLVNIVTHQDRNQAWTQGGSGGRRAYGVSLAREGAWDGGISLGQLRSDRYDRPAGVEADEERTYASGHLTIGGFGLKGSGLARSQERLVPTAPGRPVATDRQLERVSALEARYDWRLGGDNRVGLWGRHANAYYASTPLLFDGYRTEVGADLGWRFGAHRVLLQATAGGLTISDSRLPPSGPAPPGMPPPTGRRPASVSTRLSAQSFLVQDQVEIGRDLTLTGGVRFDAFADVDTRWTPRLAAVYRLTPTDTLKAQYGEGYRTPITVELYDSGVRDTGLDVEAIRTSELGYIHRDTARVVRATVFDSRIPDLITPRGPPGSGFQNRGSVRSRGVELEWSEQLAPWLRIDANVSKVDSETVRQLPGIPLPTARETFGTPDLLASVGLIARPSDPWTLGLQLTRVGDRANAPGPDLAGYHSLNASLEYKLRAVPGLSVRLGVRNATNEDVDHVLSAPPPNPASVLDYGSRRWTVEIVFSP